MNRINVMFNRKKQKKNAILWKIDLRNTMRRIQQGGSIGLLTDEVEKASVYAAVAKFNKESGWKEYVLYNDTDGRKVYVIARRSQEALNS